MSANPVAVIEAMNKKNAAQVAELIQASPDVCNTVAEGHGLTPFQHACNFARRDFALQMLAAGADHLQRAHGSSYEGQLPLHLAIGGSNSASQKEVDERTDLAVALLEKGSPVDAQALALACSLGAGKAKKLAALLVPKLPDGAIAAGGGDLLRAAVEYDHPEAVAAAIACKKIDLDSGSASFPKGTTALHLAVKKRNAPLVSALVAAGARSDIANAKGETARSLANKALLAVLDGKAAPAPKPAPAPAAGGAEGYDTWLEKILEGPDRRQDAGGLRGLAHRARRGVARRVHPDVPALQAQRGAEEEGRAASRKAPRRVARCGEALRPLVGGRSPSAELRRPGLRRTREAPRRLRRRSGSSGRASSSRSRGSRRASSPATSRSSRWARSSGWTCRTRSARTPTPTGSTTRRCRSSRRR
ncbi:MAG: hypothetical protein QM765_34770 [Myxococcales bacterium]